MTASRGIIVIHTGGDGPRPEEALAVVVPSSVPVEVRTLSELVSASGCPPRAVLVVESGPGAEAVSLVVELLALWGAGNPVVAWLPRPDAEQAVEAMKAGARDCLFGDRVERIRGLLDTGPVTSPAEVHSPELDQLGFHRTMIELSPHGFQLSDLDGVITFSNDAHHRILAAPPGGLVGQLVWDLAADDATREAIRSEYQRIIGEQPEPTVYLTRSRAFDGRVVELMIHWDYLRDGRGQLLGMCSVITDMTDLVVTRIELVEKTERSRLLFNSSPAALWDADLEAVRRLLGDTSESGDDRSLLGLVRGALAEVPVHDRNRAAMALVGEPVEAEARPPEPGLAGEIAPGVLELWRGASRSVEFETGLARRDGEDLHVLVVLSVLPGSGDTWHHVLVSMVDITARRRAEVELMASYDTLNALVENTDDLILVGDGEGRPVFFNARYGAVATEFLGFPMRPGIKPHEYLPDAEGRAFWEECHRRVLGGEKFSFEYELAQPGMTPMFLEVSYNPILSDGEVVGFSEVARDVTTRRRADQALRDSEHRYRLLVESSPMAILVHREGRIVYANQQAVVLHGGSAAADLVGRDLLDFVHPDDADDLRRYAAEDEPAASQPGRELRIRRLDGGLVDIQVRTMKVPYVAGEARLLMCLDVTEEKRTRVLLERRDAILEGVGFAAHRFLRTVRWRESLGDVLARLGDAAQVDRVVVRAWSTAQGGSAEPVGWWDADDRGGGAETLDWTDPHLRRWSEELRRGEVVTGHVRNLPESERGCLHRAGVASVVVVPVFSGGAWWGAIQFEQREGLRTFEPPEIEALGVAASALGGAVERERAEEQEELRRQQLIQADKMVSLGELVSGVAHEINNPNQFILSNAELLHRIMGGLRPVVDEYHREHGDFLLAGINYSDLRPRLTQLCEHVTDGSRRIGVIVRALREFARDQPVRLDDEVDLNRVVEAALLLVGPMIGKMTGGLDLELASGLPAVRGSAHQLEQVLVNLLQNACYACEENGGRLTVRTLRREDEGLLAVEVEDEGCGIPEDQLGRVTDPFFTSRRGRGGTGLGLSISAGIAHDHGGRLEVASAEGVGTTVSVLVPCGSVAEEGG